MNPEEILESIGVEGFDDLTFEEKKKYEEILDIVDKASITIDDWKKFVLASIEAVERSLVNEPEYIYSLPLPFLKRPNPKIVEMKARLKNYLIFKEFLQRPEKAKQMLETYKQKGAK